MPEQQTMYDVAVQWVENHRATCTKDTCGCSKADPDDMVKGLIDMWLN